MTLTPIIAYIATVIVFFTIDFIWLGFLAKDFYQNQIGFLLKSQFNVAVAVVFYLIYVIGIVYFAVHPALQAESLKFAVLNGAIFGFLAYATYDLTNLATIKDWPITVSIVDMIWGTILTGASATGGYLISREVLKHLG